MRPGTKPMPSVSGVITSPGDTALTRTRRSASSSAATSTSISTPAFDAQYAPIPAPGWRPLREAMQVIDPPSAIRAPACLITRNVPVRQMSTVLRQASSSSSVSAPGFDSPAQFTTVSKSPMSAKVVATESSSVTSRCTARAPSRVAATCSARSTSRSATTTCIPSPTNASTVASPIPDAPPITTAWFIA